MSDKEIDNACSKNAKEASNFIDSWILEDITKYAERIAGKILLIKTKSKRTYR